MTDNRQVLHAVQPDLDDVRNDAHLLVWGDLAQWMVVDEDLLAFLRLFDGVRTLEEVVHEHARRSGKPVDEVASEARESVPELERRGVLTETPGARPNEAEPVRVANLTINLTNRCNLRCAWCYNAGRTTEEMPVQALMDAIEAGRPVFDDNASFIILGGEPLIDMDRLLLALDRAGTLFTPAPMISTNGTLLTPDNVERLAQRRVEVQVSLDSATPARHDAVRGDGVYEKATAGVRRLAAAGMHTIVSMVYTRDSVSEFEAFLDTARQLSANEARLIPMRIIGRGLDHAQEAPDQLEAFEHLMNILARRPDLRPLLGRDFFSILMTVCRFSMSRTGCGVGRRVLFIDADGRVYPCPNHVRPDFCCGDLRNQDLASIFLESPAMRAVRERYHVDRYEQCRTCAFRHWCAGDCRGEALALCDDPLAPSPHCRELQEVMRRMFWLIASGDERLGTAPAPRHGKSAVDTFLG